MFLATASLVRYWQREETLARRECEQLEAKYERSYGLDQRAAYDHDRAVDRWFRARWLLVPQALGGVSL